MFVLPDLEKGDGKNVQHIFVKGEKFNQRKKNAHHKVISSTELLSDTISQNFRKKNAKDKREKNGKNGAFCPPDDSGRTSN